MERVLLLEPLALSPGYILTTKQSSLISTLSCLAPGMRASNQVITLMLWLPGELDDEDDEIDEDGAQYFEKLEKSANEEDDSDDEFDDDAEETALESYHTPLDVEECTVDEYQIFKNVLTGMSQGFFFPTFLNVYLIQLVV